MSKDKKKQKTVEATIKVSWDGFKSTLPAPANAFRLTWGEDGIILNVGFVDPESLTPENIEKEDALPVKAVGRFVMSPNSFFRLKNELDIAAKGLNENLEKLNSGE